MLVQSHSQLIMKFSTAFYEPDSSPRIMKIIMFFEGVGIFIIKNTRWMLAKRFDLLTQTQLYCWTPDSTKHLTPQCPGHKSI